MSVRLQLKPMKTPGHAIKSARHQTEMVTQKHEKPSNNLSLMPRELHNAAYTWLLTT